jgi:c-di-GMP-binding flagellar brake protein YcgR
VQRLAQLTISDLFMEHEIPLKIEILSGDDDEKHRISSAQEIGFILRNVAEKKSRIAVYYNETDDFIFTTLLDVEKTGIWLEQSLNNEVNPRIATSEKLVCVSSHFQVKIQFTTGQPEKVMHLGCPAFYIPMPKNIYRLQRREYFRLMTPVDNPPHCVITPAPPSSIPVRDITIMDISGGGVGLTCTENDTELVPGRTYPDCCIDLQDLGTIVGTIEVKNLVVLTDAHGTSIKRAGCEFQNLESSAAILLQRYVNNMQRNKT